MAEIESSDGPNLLWSVIGFIFVLMVIGTYIDRIPFFSSSSEPFDQTVSQNEIDGSGTGALARDGQVFRPEVPITNIVKGEEVIATALIAVRQTPGGSIIGEQLKRKIGTVMDGPVVAYGQEWLFVDFKAEPDGWVLASDVTNKIGTFRLFNAFPILIDIFRPIGLAFTLIFGVLLILVMMRYRKIAEFEEKKKEVEQQIITTRKENTPVLTPAEKISVAGLPGVPQNLPTGLPEGLRFGGQTTDYSGPKNERWERVERLIASQSSSDWRQAIIEADIILEEMLNKMGYQGSSIGDQLKQIEQSDFITLNKAWEAHKVRNHIAHRGGDFVFPKNEAERVIGLYRQVFQEFFYI